MKYYNLPTAKQIAEYHNGTLSIEDQRWIESSMQNNPFVNEAVKSFPEGQLDTIQQISERVGTRIRNQYAQPNGFWSKYGVWIGLSSIALLLSIAYFTKSSPDQRYFLNNMPEKLSVLLINDKNEVEEKVILSEINEEVSGEKEAVSSDIVSKKKNEAVAINTFNDESNDEIEETKNLEEEEEEEQQEKINLSGKLLKNIRGISIVQVDKNGLKRREIPEFPGGNIGLTNHFNSYIQPVELQYGEPLYDPKAQIVLNIGANGKLKNHDIKGYLHEQHKNQINSAIKNLPQFKPGKGEVSYTVEVKFN
jgi:hypothetical protein